METLTTNGVNIKVETYYQPKHSIPLEGKYIFAYQVTITNLRKSRIQLLERYWRIFDSTGNERKVNGQGVVGQQPVMEAGMSHEYISWTNLYSDLGKMEGHFRMIDLSTKDLFQVEIPAFSLYPPFKSN